MFKEELNQRLNAALGQEISIKKFSAFCSCFAEHARYLARKLEIPENIIAEEIRDPAVLRNAHEFNELETMLFCRYAGYDLTKEGSPPLW